MDDNWNTNMEADPPVPGSEAWNMVRPEALPALGQIVWLWDGQHIWMGGRDVIDSETWLWCNAYATAWHNGAKWDADLEADDDYQPTHWLRLPEPPNNPIQQRP